MNYPRVIKILLFTMAALLLLSVLVMLLWNWLLPDLIGAGELSLLQAAGLLLLCKILFGDSDSKQRRRNRKKEQDWKKRLRKKLATMNESDRASFLRSLESEPGENAL